MQKIASTSRQMRVKGLGFRVSGLGVRVQGRLGLYDLKKGYKPKK